MSSASVQSLPALLAAAPTVLPGRPATRTQHSFAGVVGATPVMQQVFARLALAANKTTPVLFTGEPGTGKSLLAEVLGQLGPRRGPRMVLYPAVLPAEELMLQLFGQERILPDGSRDITVGLLERAHGGTLLIDEIDKLDAGSQRCLRQLLTDPSYCRRGSAELRRAEVRVIAMASRPLLGLVQRGQFCETLLHLLSPTWIDLPPLRQRRDDIPWLAAAVVSELASQPPYRRRELRPATLLRLLGHGWPGNVRELRAVLLHAAEAAKGVAIEPAHLGKLSAYPRAGSETTFQPGTTLATVQRDVILMTLAAVDGNKKDAAALLGLSRGALYNHLRSYHEKAQADWRAAQQQLMPRAMAGPAADGRDSGSHEALPAVKPGQESCQLRERDAQAASSIGSTARPATQKRAGAGPGRPDRAGARHR